MKEDEDTKIAKTAPKFTSDDQISQIISHDLRAVSRALSTLPIWLREELDEEMESIPPQIDEILTMLQRQASRLDKMLSDLRTYQSLDASRRDGVISLPDAIERILPTIDVPEAFQLTQSFDVAVLTGSPSDLSLLLKILIDNAATHGASKLHIATKQDGDDVLLSAQDNGPGIAPEFHETVFQLMKQLKSRDEIEGSGIGLAIARRIVELHGGTIRVESDGAQTGASFVVRLPA